MPIFSLGFPRCPNAGLLVFLPVLLLGLSACGGGGGGSSGFSNDGTGSEDVPSMTSAEQDTVGLSVTSAEQNAVDPSVTSAVQDTSNPGSQNVGNGNPSSGSPQSAFSFPSKAKVPEVSSAILRAAKADPFAKRRNHSRHSTKQHISWTQTSEPENEYGEDAVFFEWLALDSSGADRETGIWIRFDTDHRNQGLVGIHARSVNNLVRTEIRNENGHAWADMAFYRKWTADDIDNLIYFDRYAAFGPGEIWVYAYTDADGDADGTPGEQSDEADSDYLAGGVWVYVPETFVDCSGKNVCNEHEVGIFSYGNDAFETQSMWALEGTATYDGRAVGIFTDTTRQTYFRASTEMTISFGSNIDTGDIRGRIFDFVGENGSRMSGNPVVQLQSYLSADNIEDVAGTTSHNDGTDSFTGTWVGQFYGNGHASGIPTSLGGTFDASTSDGSEVYLGAFGSHLDTYDATDFSLPQ